jgi:hypothetical protein
MMNLLKLDIKAIAILLLIGIVLFQQCGGKNNKEGETITIDGKKYEIIKHEIDTVEIEKTKTVYKKGKDIYHDTTIYVKLPSEPIDTTYILKNFYAKNVYKDTLHLVDSLGYVTVVDTISKNTILNRMYDYKVKERKVTDKKIVKELPRNQVYYGAMMGFNSGQFLNSVGGALILKTKKDKMYQLGVGVMKFPTDDAPHPFINSGIYWKVKLKK